jgi:S1-C subfamily serine protease
MEPPKNLNHHIPIKRKRRIGGMTWILIGIALLFAAGGVMTALRKSVVPPPNIRTPPQSYLGINEFEDATGGVTFEDVWPPGAPADKAGLVGGDIITAFDGHATVDEREMTRLLTITPSGKTVEIVYMRDGETKKTSLTTMSQSDVLQLDGAFTNRGTSRGQLGFEDIDAVPVPGKNIKGVLLERISPSGPAALAGLLEGDIIIEFDGVPIRTVSELVLRARRAVPYSTVKVVIIRGAEQLEIPVKIGKRG